MRGRRPAPVRLRLPADVPRGRGLRRAAVPAWILPHAGGATAWHALPAQLWHGHEMLFGFGSPRPPVSADGGAELDVDAVPRRPAARRDLAGLGRGRGCCWHRPAARLAGRGRAATRVPARRDRDDRAAAAAHRQPEPRVVAAARGVVGLRCGLPVGGGTRRCDLPAFVLAVTVDLLLVLVTVIGGRIIPAFTANAPGCVARRRARVPRPGSSVGTARRDGLLAFVDALLRPRPSTARFGRAVRARARLAPVRLEGWRTRGQPILWSLHLAYARWAPR